MAKSDFSQFKKHLKRSGHFCTAPRMRLFGVLQNNPNSTIKELVSKVTKHDQATVYRTISLFESLGIVTTTKYGSDTRIELTDDYHPHHHHISCKICGDIQTLPHSEEVENSIAHYVKDSGYSALTHKLEVQGICPRCSGYDK